MRVPAQKNVTVLGGGIGGLACAIAFAQRGFEVELIERAPSLTEVGAGIQISPNGWIVLKALGLEEQLTDFALRATAVRLRDFRSGSEVFRMPLERPFHYLHRADLISGLEKAARQQGVRIRLGTEVCDVKLAGDEVELHLADEVTETKGLTIAADGMHSIARRVLNPGSRALFTGQVAWRATLLAQDLPNEAHVFMGPGRHLVRYPLRGGSEVNIVAVEERDQWAAEDWAFRDQSRDLHLAFRDFAPEVRDLLAQVEEPFLWGLFRHPVAAGWTKGSLALLGDAAHPTLPFLAQGANMALEDAWILADCVDAISDPAAALARYEGLRKPRCYRLVEAANDNANRYHLHPGPLRFAAHSALRLASRVAPHLIARQFDWIYRYDATRQLSR